MSVICCTGSAPALFLSCVSYTVMSLLTFTYSRYIQIQGQRLMIRINMNESYSQYYINLANTFFFNETGYQAFLNFEMFIIVLLGKYTNAN